ncbi:hypothetical protein V6Z11_A01G211500 [Gossypium hirsutum]
MFSFCHFMSRTNEKKKKKKKQDVASCLITSIKGLLSRLWHVRINHIARENDMVENMIAKEANLPQTVNRVVSSSGF